MLQSQRPDPRRTQVMPFDQDVQLLMENDGKVCGLLLYDFISLLFLFILDMGYLFLPFSLLYFFSSCFEHGFISFYFFFCILHVSFARILLERETSQHMWSFIWWMDGILLASSVEV
jgi:hypothetical protein